MKYNNRFSKHRNFSDSSETMAAEQVEAVASIVAMVDPAKVDEDTIEIISDATGVTEETVETLVDVVESLEGESESTKIEVFNRKVSKLKKSSSIKKSFSRKMKRNFADESATEVTVDDVNAVVEIVSVLDDNAFDELDTKEIVESISDAVEVPAEVVESIVDVAACSFSAGKKVATKKFSRKTRKNRHFSKGIDIKVDSKLIKEIAEKDMSVEEVMKKTGAPKEIAEGIIEDVFEFARSKFSRKSKTRRTKFASYQEDEADNKLQGESEIDMIEEDLDITQDKEDAEVDPEAGDDVSDTTAVEDALKMQNDIATVTSVKDVTSNYSRTKRIAGRSSNTSVLKSLLGDKYVPNN